MVRLSLKEIRRTIVKQAIFSCVEKTALLMSMMNSFGNTTKAKQNIRSFWWSQKCWFSLLPQTGLIKIMTMTLILGHCAGDLHILFCLVIPAAYWGRSKDPQVKDKETKVEQNLNDLRVLVEPGRKTLPSPCLWPWLSCSSHVPVSSPPLLFACLCSWQWTYLH